MQDIAPTVPATPQPAQTSEQAELTDAELHEIAYGIQVGPNSHIQYARAVLAEKGKP